MKGKILGGYEFVSKKSNKAMASVCISDDSKINVVGTVANCYPVMKSNLPADLKDMIGKTYIVDKDDIGFLSAFYEVK